MSFRLANHAGQAVLLDGGDYWSLGIDPMEALADLDELHHRWASRGAPDGQASPAELRPPVPAPKQVFGYGLNYMDHIEEIDKVDPLGRKVSEAPRGVHQVPHLPDRPRSSGATGRRPLRLRVRAGGGHRRGNRRHRRGPGVGPGGRADDRPRHLRPGLADRGLPAPVLAGQVPNVVRSHRPPPW